MLGRTLTIAVSVLALTLVCASRGVRAEATEQEVKTVLAEFEQTNPTIKPFMESAYGYAVFPTVGKGTISPFSPWQRAG